MKNTRLRRYALYLFAGSFLLTCVGCSPVPSVDSLGQDSALLTPQTIFDTDSAMNLKLSPELHIRQIDQGAYVITHDYPWPANSLLLEMDNGVLVWVGSTYTPQAAEEVLAWVQGTFGDRQMIAINTGYHVDNLGGNAALMAQNIPIYGSDMTVKLLEERGDETRQLMLDMMKNSAKESVINAHREIPYLPPTQVFPLKDGLELQFGEEKILVIYPGPSQAPDKVVVYFPQHKILFGGCMILSADQVGNTADADIPAWIEAVKTLQQFPVEFVIPGHGERIDPELISHTIEVLEKTQ